MNNDSGVANPDGGANLPIINPNSPANGITPTDLMSTIQSKLLDASGAISSSSSNIENTITSAIAKTQESGDASKKAAGISYDKQIETATDKATSVESAFLEAQRGFATNTAALTDLRKNNAKSISALEDSKQQALLSADSATASKISDLILQKYQFEQQATQQVFSNLVSIGNFGLQLAQEKRLNATQTFNEDQAKSTIALKYGINVEPGDTFQDVVNRAKPFASKEEQSQLDQAAATLANTKANTSLALANAQKAITDKNATDLTSNDFSVYVKAALSADPNATADSIKAKIQGLAGLTAAQRQQGYDAVDKMFADNAAASASSSSGGASGFTPLNNGNFSSPLLNFGVGVGNAVGNVSTAITDFIFGKDSPLNLNRTLK